MAEAGLAAPSRLPRDYQRVERSYLDWAAALGACPAALDLFLWDVQRALKGSRATPSLPLKGMAAAPNGAKQRCPITEAVDPCVVVVTNRRQVDAVAPTPSLSREGPTH